MQTKKVIGLIVVFVVLLGVSVWMFNDAQEQKQMMSDTVAEQKAGESMMEKKDTMMVANDSMMQADAMEKPTATTSMMQKNGSYELYSAEKIALANSGDVVLFFKAGWCPTCRAVDADIKANMSAITGNLTILEVDYDNSSALKKKYGVTRQHTFVQVDGNGELIKKWTGGATLASILTQVQ